MRRPSTEEASSPEHQPVDKHLHAEWLTVPFPLQGQLGDQECHQLYLWTFVCRAPGQRDCWRGRPLTKGALFSQPTCKAQGENNSPMSPPPEDLIQHPEQSAQTCPLLCLALQQVLAKGGGMKEGSAVLAGNSAGAASAPQGLQGLLHATGPMCKRELFTPNCRPTAKIIVFVQMLRARKLQELFGANH